MFDRHSYVGLYIGRISMKVRNRPAQLNGFCAPGISFGRCVYKTSKPLLIGEIPVVRIDSVS